MDGAQCHLRDHRSVAFFDLLLRARESIDGIPGGHVPVVPVERDHRLRWQFPLNDSFPRIWPVNSACLVRKPLRIYGGVQDKGAELCDSFRVPGPAVPLELVDAGIVPGDVGSQRSGGRVVGGSLLCQLPAPVGLPGRMLLDGPGIGCAGAFGLPLKAPPAAKDLA